MSVKFFNQTPYNLKNKKILKAYIKYVFEREKKNLNSIVFVLCDDNYILSLNRKYLHHNFYTDILTFDLSINKKSIIAEVYISIDRVNENSDLIKVLFINELNRVILHGVLHLCGYNDQNKTEKKRIREKENEYLELLSKSFT